MARNVFDQHERTAPLRYSQFQLGAYKHDSGQLSQSAWVFDTRSQAALRHLSSHCEQHDAKSCEGFLSTRTVMLSLALLSKSYSHGQGRLIMSSFQGLAEVCSANSPPVSRNIAFAYRVARLARDDELFWDAGTAIASYISRCQWRFWLSSIKTTIYHQFYQCTSTQHTTAELYQNLTHASNMSFPPIRFTPFQVSSAPSPGQGETKQPSHQPETSAASNTSGNSTTSGDSTSNTTNSSNTTSQDGK